MLCHVSWLKLLSVEVKFVGSMLLYWYMVLYMVLYMVMYMVLYMVLYIQLFAENLVGLGFL